MAIDRGRIVDEAMTLLNEVGIDKLTTRKLAERLGVQQPALYWHFKNKSALLDAINSEMLARYHTHRLPAPGEDWVDFTYATARSMRKTLLAVRDGARIAAGTRPSTTDFADAELAPFPILAEAFQSLEKDGSINTEQAFERGLRYMVEGMKLSLAAKS